LVCNYLNCWSNMVRLKIWILYGRSEILVIH
ncbi:hypothetical protein HZ326_31808, partial [Fusarium oxysporum f. sp. albedinis]